MSDGRADVIVVGGGVAAGAAALGALQHGGHVLWLDPGDGSASDTAGAGLLGASDVPASLRGRIPSDRTIVDRRLTFLNGGASVSIEYGLAGRSMDHAPSSWVPERARPWLAHQVREAGGELRTAAIDRLLTTGRAVRGVVAGGNELIARITVLADGPRATELGRGVGRPAPEDATREVTLRTDRRALAATMIERRFALAPGVGRSEHFVLPTPPGSAPSSGFLVTHSESLTVGVRLRGRIDPGAADRALAKFAADPAVEPRLRGSTPMADASALRRFGSPPGRVEGPGWRLCGDAGGFPPFRGAVLRGRNPAFVSGWLAGATAARDLGPRGGDGSGSYHRSLRRSGLLARRGTGDDPLVGDRRIHAFYPELLATAFHRLMTESGAPKEKVVDALLAVRKGSHRGWIAYARDGTAALRHL